MQKAEIVRVPVAFKNATYNLLIDKQVVFKWGTLSEVSLYRKLNYPDSVLIKDKPEWVEIGLHIEPDQNDTEFWPKYQCTHCDRVIIPKEYEKITECDCEKKKIERIKQERKAIYG